MLKFQAKFRFSKRSKHTCDKSFTFLVVTCLDYDFVQSVLVDIGFLKVYTVRDFCSILQPEKIGPLSHLGVAFSLLFSI